MLFTSYEFILFAIAVILIYYIVPLKIRWIWLLIASYTFYFAANPVYLIYILVTTLTIWALGLRIDKKESDLKAHIDSNKETLSKEERKALKADAQKGMKRYLLAGIFASIGILAVVKYTNFFISNVNSVIGAFGSERTLSFVNIIVPMGLSFYTFQAVSYLIDVHRRTVKAEKNPFKFALFVSFFPQLVQGPISRFNDLSPTLLNGNAYNFENLARGLQRMLWGYFKKMVIADRILPAVTTITQKTDMYGGAYVFVGMVFYAIELYADFTGGIDITIGIAEAMGIKMAENFQRPFFSKNVKEYWNRWHITMGSWFTDYIFYPVSVSKPMLTISKKSRKAFGETIGKKVPVYLSSFTVWFLTGFWHGASWNFIVWGLGNFVVIMISQEFDPLFNKFRKAFPKLVQSRFYHFFQIARTLFIMSLLRTFDCYRNVPLTFRMWKSMVTDFNVRFLTDGSIMALGLSAFDYIIILVGITVLITVSMVQRSGSVRTKIMTKPYAFRFFIWFGLFLLVLLFGAYGVGYDASQFIYNQF